VLAPLARAGQQAVANVGNALNVPARMALGTGTTENLARAAAGGVAGVGRWIGREGLTSPLTRHIHPLIPKATGLTRLSQVGQNLPIGRPLFRAGAYGLGASSLLPVMGNVLRGDDPNGNPDVRTGLEEGMAGVISRSVLGPFVRGH
jgi:hypothetical protein